MLWRRRQQREQDLERELRSHLESEASEQRESGLSAEEARYAARRAFGNTTLVKEDVREMWGWASLDRLWQDVRYALHILSKNYGFTAVAVLSLAMGIGANSAIFSVIDSVLFRPLPYREPQRLVDVWGQDLKKGKAQGTISYPDFLDLRSQNGVFTDMAAYRDSHSTVLTDGDPERVDAAIVSPNLLDLLGATSELGRTFGSGIEIAGDGRVTVLSHALWQNRFHADPGIIGHAVGLDGQSYTVIGVMPAGFEFPILAEPIQLWIPVAPVAYDGEMSQARNSHVYTVIARLKPRATEAQAAVQMNTIADRLERQYSAYLETGDKIRLVMHMSGLVGGARETLVLLFGAVGVVLLIACINVANLILVGATHRSREVAIRTALGASRFRLMRQFLTENLILAVLGGSLGLVLGCWAIQAVAAIGPRDIPRLTTVRLNGTVLVFTLGISLICTLLFGLVPALRLSKAGLNESLTARGRGATSSASAGRLRDVLVTSEIALSLVMVLAAGLLLQTLWHLQRVNPGFDPTHVLTFDLSVPDSGAKRVALFEELVSRIRTVPGVTSATMTFPLPFSGSGINTGFDIEGQHPAPGDTPMAALCTADRNYFATMHIPLLKGTGFPATDGVRAKPVAVINEAFAKRYFPGENPIGKRLQQGAEAGGVTARMSEIVGVVGDLKLNSLREEPKPMVIVPVAQFPINAMSVVVRSQTDPRGLLTVIRQSVQSVDRDVLILRGKTLDQYLGALLGQPRFTAGLLSIFAGLALTLATVGLYGAISYAVSQRTQEIGIRMAFGATQATILKLILSHSLRLIVPGIAAGLVLALSLTHLITSLLFGVTPNDPITILAVSILLSVVAALASYIPARQAMLVDPMVALRDE